jgi:hypothetical protein
VAALGVLSQVVAIRLLDAVTDARARGAPRTAIGAVFGIIRQAAHERFSRGTSDGGTAHVV